MLSSKPWPKEEIVKHPLSLLLAVSAGVALSLASAPAQAQLVESQVHRFEVAPFAGYQWGGSFDTDAGGTFPAGELKLAGSFGWGAVVSFLAATGSAAELWYLRQDTDVSFDQAAGGSTDLGGFATNYIHIGGRQSFGQPGGIRPFVNASLGITVFDPKASGIGTSTRFSFAFGGGFQKMLGAAQRAGIRADARMWLTPVPSGEYGVWCGFYGCFAAEGTAWVNQGQVTGGLVFAF